MNYFTRLADVLCWIHIFGIILFCSAQAIAETTYAPCYYPDGTFEPNDMPCSSQDGGCCPPRWICLGDGVCYLPTDASFECHTCTDNVWGPHCPNWCITRSTYNQTASMSLCSNHTEFCCGPDCCDDAVIAKTPAGDLTFITSLGEIQAAWTSALGNMVSASAASRNSPSTTTDASSTSSVSVSVSIVTFVPPSQTSSSDIAATSSSQTGLSLEDQNTGTGSTDKSHTSTIVGTAVGIPIGLAAAALLFYLLRRRYLKKNDHSTPDQNNEVLSTDDHYPVLPPKPELATLPNTLVELPSHGTASELEISMRAASILSNSVSASVMTGADEARWSVVSSLAPPGVMTPPVGRGMAPMASRLQAVSEHQRDSSWNSLRSEPRQNSLRETDNSAFLSAIEVAGSDNTLTARAPEGITHGCENRIERDGVSGQQDGIVDGGEAAKGQQNGTTKAGEIIQAGNVTETDDGQGSDIAVQSDQAERAKKSHQD